MRTLSAWHGMATPSTVRASTQPSADHNLSASLAGSQAQADRAGGTRTPQRKQALFLCCTARGVDLPVLAAVLLPVFSVRKQT